MNHANSKFLIVDLHIRTLNPEGHFFDRARSLAALYNNQTKRAATLMCSLLNFEKNIYKDFENIVSTSGFDSFQNPVISPIDSSTPHFQLIAQVLKEYWSSLVTPKITSVDEGFENFTVNKIVNEKIFENINFANYIIGNIDRLYCTRPKEVYVIAGAMLETICPRKFSDLISFTNIKELTDAISIIKIIYVRDHQEKSALQRIAAWRIAENGIKSGFTNIVFLTASKDDLIGILSGICAIKKSEENDEHACKISLIFHQPNEWKDQEATYLITGLYRSLKESNSLHTVNLYASCFEFKEYLSRAEFLRIGEDFKIATGPFLEGELLNNGSLSKFDKYRIKGSLKLKKKYSNFDSGKIDWALNQWRNNSCLTSDDKYYALSVEAKYNKNLQTGFNLASQIESRPNQPIFVFLGDIRDEKNFQTFSVIATSDQFISANAVAVFPTFFSKGNIVESEEALERLLAYERKFPKNYLSYHKSLTDFEYKYLIKHAWLIFGAYDRNEYANKQSGIFFECLLKGASTLITLGTSASHSLGYLANAIIEDHGIKKVVDKLISAENKFQIFDLSEIWNASRFVLVRIVAKKPLAIHDRKLHCFFKISLLKKSSVEPICSVIHEQWVDFRGGGVLYPIEINHVEKNGDDAINMMIHVDAVIGLDHRDQVVVELLTSSLDELHLDLMTIFSRHKVLPIDSLNDASIFNALLNESKIFQIPNNIKNSEGFEKIKNYLNKDIAILWN